MGNQSGAFSFGICFHMMYNNFKDLVDGLHIGIIINKFLIGG